LTVILFLDEDATEREPIPIGEIIDDFLIWVSRPRVVHIEAHYFWHDDPVTAAELSAKITHDQMGFLPKTFVVILSTSAFAAAIDAVLIMS
jgi:hypothetical protein